MLNISVTEPAVPVVHHRSSAAEDEKDTEEEEEEADMFAKVAERTQENAKQWAEKNLRSTKSQASEPTKAEIAKAQEEQRDEAEERGEEALAFARAEIAAKKKWGED